MCGEKYKKYLFVRDKNIVFYKQTYIATNCMYKHKMHVKAICKHESFYQEADVAGTDLPNGCYRTH